MQARAVPPESMTPWQLLIAQNFDSGTLWYPKIVVDMFTLDRLVVVDTSAVANVAVPCMSRIQWFGGGQSLDPQDAKLIMWVG